MSEAPPVISGKVYVVGDNIDTDQIIPAQYLNLVPTIAEEYRQLGSYAMIGLPDDYPPFVAAGEMEAVYPIVIAGRNFGCGSSREHAPIALGAAGVKAVVADSYARIFFRNAVATGELYPMEAEVRLVDVLQTGDKATLDIGAGTLTTAAGETYNLKPIGDVAPVVSAGGIFAYARETGMISAT